MTRKEELLNWIEVNINETNMLVVAERVEYAPPISKLESGQHGKKTFGKAKIDLIELINNKYTDNLFGVLSNDQYVLEIISWDKRER